MGSKPTFCRYGRANDVMGVESAVALKNGYALGITLTVGVY